jgi:hypothetical protein
VAETPQQATLRGILERNEAVALEDPAAGYHLNHVTIELDLSELPTGAEGALDESLEGLPVSVEGRFETREHPESGVVRWVFKAREVRQEVPGDRGGPLSAPPPPA